MRIVIGSDHAGFALKNDLVRWLDQRGLCCCDVGPHSYDVADDYPDYARVLGEALVRGDGDLGIMVCGTGVGSSIALNKISGIRAAACSDTYSARLSRQHNDANVLCLGERVVGTGLARELVTTWLEAAFSGEERHRRRVEKVAALERPVRREG